MSKAKHPIVKRGGFDFVPARLFSTYHLAVETRFAEPADSEDGYIIRENSIARGVITRWDDGVLSLSRVKDGMFKRVVVSGHLIPVASLAEAAEYVRRHFERRCA